MLSCKQKIYDKEKYSKTTDVLMQISNELLVLLPDVLELPIAINESTCTSFCSGCSEKHNAVKRKRCFSITIVR